MTRATLFVFSNPVSLEREAEYNDWYNNVHLPQVLEVPGVVQATRFLLSDIPTPNPPAGYRYVALYELEADNLEELADAIAKAPVSTSDAMDLSGVSTAIYEHFHGPVAKQVLRS